MKKKVKKEESVKEIGVPPVGTGSAPEVCTKVCTKKIDKLEIDLGRGDLNLLRDKINEIIEHGN